MTAFLRRLCGLFTVLGVVLGLNFFLFRLLPGDPLTVLIDPNNYSQEAKEREIALWGLDKPKHEQFAIYIKRMVSFDFGYSMTLKQPIWDLLRDLAPNTVALLLPALVLAAALGVWLGVKAALTRGSKTERLVLASSAISFSFPSFFVQLLLLLGFAYTWQIFPNRGTVSTPSPEGGEAVLDYLWHLALPLFSLVFLSFGGWALYVRNMMLKALGEDYVLMARARGLSRRQVVWRHAFRSILPPLLTIFLLSLPGVVSGAVITERVFARGGVGSFLFDAINLRDYPAIEAAFFLLALLIVGCNLLADLAYALLDPRVRRGRVH
ncbi:MAG: ABC transporter permease [Synergistaceae bacterium]|jgi:peptide/nickel transport system permease protein|nr:ABC transporter permease [Synergistaceae bacterium]